MLASLNGSITGGELACSWTDVALGVERVDRADDAAAAAHVEDVGVDHGGLDVFVPENLLDGSDVVAVHQEVGGKGVAEGVAADLLRDSGLVPCLVDRLADNRFVEMVAAGGVGAGVGAAGAGGTRGCACRCRRGA